MAGLIDFLIRELSFWGWKISILHLIFAVFFILVGIFLGKIAKSVLKNVAEKAELRKTVKGSFIELFLTLVEWSIYILFINLSLNQLNIPQLTSWLTNILIVIPALVGALILIAVGFIIASYLRDTIEESKILNYEILSNIVFYFVLYVFFVFAFRTALISMDTWIVNIILVVVTAALSFGLILWLFKSKK